MTPKQERFCEEYLVDLNATQAAIRAGYSEKTAKDIACQNLAKLNIQERIAGLRKEQSERTQITADRVVEELKYIGLANIKNYVDKSAKGFVTFKDIDEISEEDARAIEGESWAVNFIADRVEGKVMQPLDVSGQIEAVIVSDKFLPKDENGAKS